jgi:hypothetical protein
MLVVFCLFFEKTRAAVEVNIQEYSMCGLLYDGQTNGISDTYLLTDAGGSVCLKI